PRRNKQTARRKAGRLFTRNQSELIERHRYVVEVRVAIVGRTGTRPPGIKLEEHEARTGRHDRRERNFLETVVRSCYLRRLGRLEDAEVGVLKNHDYLAPVLLRVVRGNPGLHLDVQELPVNLCIAPEQLN